MLSVRGIEPNKGMLDSIGGFIDLNESIEQGLSREIAEETGMDASQYSTPTYFASAHGSYVHDGETRSVLSSFYFATMNTNANPVASDDVAAFEYVDLPTFDRTRIGNTDVLAVIDDLLTATA